MLLITAVLVVWPLNGLTSDEDKKQAMLKKIQKNDKENKKLKEQIKGNSKGNCALCCQDIHI